MSAQTPSHLCQHLFYRLAPAVRPDGLGTLDAGNACRHLRIPASIRPPDQYRSVDLAQKRQIIGRVPQPDVEHLSTPLTVETDQDLRRLSLVMVAGEMKEAIPLRDDKTLGP